jgi:galactose-1-phosphate uridylyltransferase
MDDQADGAVFSSDEEAAPGKDNTDYKNPLDELNSPDHVEHKAPVVKYNPAQVVQKNKPVDQNNFYFNSNEGQQVVVPILYDPLHKTSIKDFTPPQFIQPMNPAMTGSLLKVWTGKLDLQTRQSMKHSLIDVECFST